VSDDGLANFRNCKGLVWLQLGNMAKVTDQGVGYFKDCKNLEILGLSDTPKITGMGLLQFKDCAKLVEVDVTGTKVRKEDVEQLKTTVPNCQIEGP
jgi:hypothetical protein